MNLPAEPTQGQQRDAVGLFAEQVGDLDHDFARLAQRLLEPRSSEKSRHPYVRIYLAIADEEPTESPTSHEPG